MPRATSFVIGDHFGALIAKQLASGRYANASEVMREALRLFEVREERVEVLRAALKEGAESGVWKEFTEPGQLASAISAELDAR